MSKYKVDCCFADGKSEQPFLIIIPELWINHVKLELKGFTLNKISIGKGCGGLRVDEDSIQLGRVSILTFNHPRNAQVKETTGSNVHVDCSGFFLF